MNRSIERYSEGVIYDTTSPLIGTTQVERGISHFVKSRHISVQWFGIDDRESGIEQFEIGIGSTNHSADIVPFQNTDMFAEINGDSRLVDGYQYYAIIKVLT